jgi:hypothetical protein
VKCNNMLFSTWRSIVELYALNLEWYNCNVEIPRTWNHVSNHECENVSLSCMCWKNLNHGKRIYEAHVISGFTCLSLLLCVLDINATRTGRTDWWNTLRKITIHSGAVLIVNLLSNESESSRSIFQAITLKFTSTGWGKPQTKHLSQKSPSID